MPARRLNPMLLGVLWALVGVGVAPAASAQQYNWIPRAAEELPPALIPPAQPGVHAYQVTWTHAHMADQTQVVEVPENGSITGAIGDATYFLSTQIVYDEGVPDLLTRMSVGMVNRSDLIGVGQFRTIATGLTRTLTVRRLT